MDNIRVIKLKYYLWLHYQRTCAVLTHGNDRFNTWGIFTNKPKSKNENLNLEILVLQTQAWFLNKLLIFPYLNVIQCYSFLICIHYKTSEWRQLYSPWWRRLSASVLQTNLLSPAVTHTHINIQLMQDKVGYLVFVLLTLHTVIIGTIKMEMWFVVGVDFASN